MRAVPVDRLRAYDMRRAVDAVFDVGSILELRSGFGVGMITALARIEGRPVGVLANNPTHLAGAIDSDGADKAARFMQLCDAFGLPIVTLVDTPGMMVGPEVEATALVRHCSRLFVTGANLTVPLVSIVTRKAYGLGAQAMMGGSTKAPLACLAWPTGEFGGMGLEGAVRLGYRKELEAATDDAERGSVVPDDGRPDVRTRQGGERRDALRDRRRDRPGRHPPLDHHPARRRPRNPLERHRRLRHPPAPQHRHLVTVIPSCRHSTFATRNLRDRSADFLSQTRISAVMIGSGQGDGLAGVEDAEDVGLAGGLHRRDEQLGWVR